MKHWRQAIGALVTAMTTTLPAQADLFTVTDSWTGDQIRVTAYGFDMSHPGTFSAFAHTPPGVHLLLPAGEPGAGFRRIAVKPPLVPEPALWLTIGVGVILIGVVKLRASDHIG